MKQFFYTINMLVLMLLCSVSANAVSITKTQGWFESGAVEWTWEAGASYTVYYRSEGGSYQQLDKELVRQYTTYGRADMVGLKAGKYQFKVVSSKSGSAESAVFTATAHDRAGFAHYGRTVGIGAYNNDGTLKANARVIYLTGANAKTVKCTVLGDKEVEYTGIQAIIGAYEKGKETRPLDVRIIGTVKKADLDACYSNEGLQVKGKSGSNDMNITIEGIGEDAAVHGFGFLLRSAGSVEFRNFAIMLCLDDCVSIDTDNKRCWVHGMDFFYGGTGGDADQAKGDGTVDIKGKSSHITVSYNHFFDSGKCSLGGMKSETTDCWMTYHHNWFDHSDSRHPRIRTAFYHVYNNYYDGNAKYGIGVTSGGSSFVESNYFRNCKYPMLSSKQGTDAEGDGTFSGEPGGVIKAYDNKIINPKKVQYWSEAAAKDGAWDAVKVDSRDASVTATAYSGGTAYNNAATTEAIKAVPASAIDATEDVALIVRGEKEGRLGAGRMNGGDFKWTFWYPNQDANYDVISDLKSTVVNYKSTLVAYGDGTAALNAGATSTVNGGDGAGKSQKIGDDTNVPSWGGSDAVDTDLKPYIIGIDNDFYWFNEANDATTKKYNADGIITWDSSSSYGTTKQATSSDGSFTGPYIGGVAVAKASGYIQFYCPDLISSITLKAVRSGSAAGKILSSQDGVSFKEIGSYSTSKKGEFNISTSLADEAKYVRVTNTTTGTLYIHGIKIYTVGEAEPDEREASDLTVVTTTKNLSIGDTYTLTKGTDYTTSSTGAVSYSSNKPAVASIDANGKITAVSEGTATITISQEGDDTYKSAYKTMTVTVTDPRAASSFKLTSAATVSLKEGETSQITTSGAAGTVTYSSSKTSVATVDANGKITAVAAGSATITVSDPGTSTVKGQSYTIAVAVTKDMTGTEICYFTASTKTPSSSMVTVSGNYSDSKGSVTYNGTEYKDCVKMETSTAITVTPSSDCTVTVYFDTPSKSFLLDGTKTTLNANGQYSFTATGGKTYTLKKSDSMNLFLIVFAPITNAISNIATTDTSSVIYTLDGRRIATPVKGQPYILNGKKYMAK